MKFVVFSLMIASMFLTSCATIFTRSSYPISINTEPEGATITITNYDGKEVYCGSTPANVKLKASRGYMKSATYYIKLSKPGYEDKKVIIQSNFDYWYLGNVMIGGLIGMLAVDPVSGAMYRFKKEDRTIMETLQKDTDGGLMTLYIMDINQLPDGIDKDSLEKI